MTTWHGRIELAFLLHVIAEAINSVRTHDTHDLKSVQVKSCFGICYHLPSSKTYESSYSSICIIYDIVSVQFNTVHIRYYEIISKLLFTACSKSCLAPHQQLQQKNGRLRQPPGLKTHRLRCGDGTCRGPLAPEFMEGCSSVKCFFKMLNSDFDVGAPADLLPHWNLFLN